MAGAGQQQPLTVREKLELNELIRMESMEVQKVQAMLPMIGDADLKAELSGCVQTATAHVKALVEFCKAKQIVH